MHTFSFNQLPIRMADITFDYKRNLKYFFPSTLKIVFFLWYFDARITIQIPKSQSIDSRGKKWPSVTG